MDREAAELVDELLHVAHLLRGVLAGHFAEFNLTDVRYAVLRIVRDAAPEGCSQVHLAERLNQAVSSISMLVDRMRTDGLVYRLRSKTDRRKRSLMLAQKGRELLEQLERCHAQRMDRLFAGLTRTERRTLRAALAALSHQLAQLGASGRPAAGRTVRSSASPTVRQEEDLLRIPEAESGAA